MFPKKILGSGLCLVTIAWGVVRLRGETVVVPELSSPTCIDGACIPRRLTNGYYQTKWRRWPIEPAAPAKPGVREGISAPALEVPDPERESALPPGVFAAPAPSDEPQPEPDSDPARSTAPRAQPPTRTMPRTDPGDDLPLDLRGAPLPRTNEGTPRYPSDIRPSRRTPAVAAARGNRPAAVLEALRNEATRQHGEAEQSRGLAAPAVLPVEVPSAKPLPQTQRAAGVRVSLGHSESTERSAGLSPMPINRGTDLPQTDHNSRTSNPAGEPFNVDRHPGREEHPRWQQRRASQENIEVEREGPRLSGTRLDSMETESTASPAGLNMPTTIEAQRSANMVMRASAAVDVSTNNPAPAAVLAVRNEHQTRNIDQPIMNPLRGGTTRIAFDRSRLRDEHKAPAQSREVSGGALSSARMEIPTNPLR